MFCWITVLAQNYLTRSRRAHPQLASVFGFEAAIKYLEAIGLDDIHRFEEEIGSYLYESLTAFKEVNVYRPPPPRAAPSMWRVCIAVTWQPCQTWRELQCDQVIIALNHCIGN